MAIKDFILTDSYSRIERVDVQKSTKTVDFYLSVYKDNTCQIKLAQDIRYTAKNDLINDITEYDSVFAPALKLDVNIIAICYQQLMALSEFANTMEV